jgi:triosephosphate isomerase (TIM)
MAKSILVANWKNNPDSVSSAENIVRGLAKKSALFKKLNLYIAPPVVYLEVVTGRKGSFAQLGIQDLATATRPTETGSLTVPMIKNLGVRLAILGHSERRALGESDENVRDKVKLALRSSITPLVCVGEKVRDDDGNHLELLKQQIKHSLEGIKREEARKIMLAYEPVWAIGTEAKGAITPEDLAESLIFIKKILSDIFGREVGSKIPILYGGSVDAVSAELLASVQGVRGFLVGRASLDPKTFVSIAETLV